MNIGGRYNWKGQKERLVYLGHNCSGNGHWHQFALVDNPGVIWCEVKTSDLHLIEETEDKELKIMKKINDGGPAFPASWNPDQGVIIEEGMTLRDYFAAKAMCGLIAQSNGSALASDLLIGSEYAYRMADAMLVAREVQS